MKKKTATSQKPAVPQQTGRNTSSIMSKSGESTRTRKRTKEISSNPGSINDRVHDTRSDISADEAEDPVPSKRRRISIIYSYAEKLSEVEYRCKLCTKLIRCGVGTNSNIKRHLINVHGLDHLKPKNDWSVPKRPFDAYRKAILDEAAIKCIVLDSRPFGDFRKKGMKNFLTTALPGYDGPHAITVTRTIKKLYTDKLLELKEELNNTPYVCLTTDLWRRPKKHHYLCVTVHYLDSAYLSISKVLSFRRFHGRHLGTRIRNHLNRIVHRFQLESKIVAIVSDNGGDMRVATQQPDVFGVRLYCLAHGLNNTVQKALEFWKNKKDKQDTSTNSTRPQDDDDDDPDDVENEEESTDESDDEDEKTPTTSTTTLSVDSDGSNVVNDDFDLNDEDECEAPRDDTDIISSDDDMEEDDDELPNHPSIIDNINYILVNCRKIVNAINRSTILYQNIQTLARPTVNGDLTIDMCIRWNSTCKMITRLLKYRPILTVFMDQLPSIDGVTPKKKQKLLKMQLSDKEWNILDKLNSTLMFFHDASDMLSGSKYPSYSIAYLVIDSLYHYLQISTTNDVEATIKRELSETFNKYVYHSPDSPEHNLLLVCAFFDPVVHDLMDDYDKISAKKILMIEASGTRDTTRNITNNPSSSMLTTDPPVTTISSTTNTSFAERLKLFRVKCGIIEQGPMPTKSKTLTLRQEIAKFESFDKTEHSFATFWQKYGHSLPLLSKMARRYGSVPASSVPSESSFSVAGYTARKNRSSLTAKNLKYSMFLKDKI